MNYSKIDILAINETKLDSFVSDEEVRLPGFEIVRGDRLINGRIGGGVCIYLRNNLNFRRRDNLLTNIHLECIIVEVTNPQSSPYLICTWYRPPGSPSEAYNAFEELIKRLDAEDKEIYLLGDLNSDLLPDDPQDYNREATRLTNILDTYGLSQLIKEPTHFTPTSQSLVDVCITNCPDKIVNSGVLHLGISCLRG